VIDYTCAIDDMCQFCLPAGRSAGHYLTTRWIQRFHHGTLAIQLSGAAT
jgi:hypothetical protein